ncbi:unnamed protein product, partial [Scytosiphon promiscuus]
MAQQQAMMPQAFMAPMPIQFPAHVSLINAPSFNPEAAAVDGTRFFVIKTFSEDDIHRSVKLSVWSGGETSNRRLDSAFRGNKSGKESGDTSGGKDAAAAAAAAATSSKKKGRKKAAAGGSKSGAVEGDAGSKKAPQGEGDAAAAAAGDKADEKGVPSAPGTGEDAGEKQPAAAAAAAAAAADDADGDG